MRAADGRAVVQDFVLCLAHLTSVTSSPPSRELEPAKRPPITVRGILIGAVGALAIGFGCPYAALVLRGSYMDLDFSTPGAIFLLFFLVVGPNLLLRKLRRKWTLTSSELITAYVMMLFASAIPTMGLTAQLLPLTTAPFYYATPENHWQELISPHIADWLVPRGADVGERVIVDFFEGSRTGVGVPWRAWLPALGAWIPFLLCIHFVMICMMVVLRRQWVEREKLVYPLTHLPLELCGSPVGRVAVPLLRDKAMWIGFGVSFIIGSLIGLHNYWPLVPLPVLLYSIPVFRNRSHLLLRLSFPMLGFFFLVSLDTSFGVWFFNILYFIARGTMNVLGVGLQENIGPYGANAPTFKLLGMGAMIALVLGGLWLARPHLRDVWRRAVLGDRSVDDSDEILPYGVAFWGMVLGLFAAGVWLGYSGIPPLMVVVFLFGAFVLFIGLTRIVVESGMAEAVASTISPGFSVATFGTAAFGKRGLVALGLTYVWCSDIRTFVMASCANGLKMMDSTGRAGRRRIFPAAMLAIVLAIASSMWVTLKWGYDEGGTTMNSWFWQGGPMACYRWVQEKLISPSPPSIAGWGLTAAGAAIMLFLQAMRMRFTWWPFHPVGFAIGGVWIMDQIWFTCFLSWLIKAVILRYGSMKTFRAARPFFLGLILGQFTCNGVWLFIDQFTGHTQNRIFWI